MQFSDITGHKDIKQSLKEIVDSGKIPHALLFSGVSGIGKMRMARAMAQYIHCKNRQNGDSCGKCPSCLQHQNHNNPDLHYIYPVLKKDGGKISTDYIDEWKQMLDSYSYMPIEKWNELLKAGNSQPLIYVDESQEIIVKSSFSSLQEDIKIFIIWLPEKLKVEAANKLLKIIEEPFEDTLFILVSNDESRILPTILSRTQRFRFLPLGKEEIAELLNTRGINPQISQDVARISGGSLEKAEELACHPEEINEFGNYFKELMRGAYSLNAKKLKEISDETASFGREKLIRFLTYCSRMIRENFIYNFSTPGVVYMTVDEENFSHKFSPFIHEGNVERLCSEISRAITDIERNANSKIVMFDLSLLLSRLVRQQRETILPFIEFDEII